jgi:hypothetical protein
VAPGTTAVRRPRRGGRWSPSQAAKKCGRYSAAVLVQKLRHMPKPKLLELSEKNIWRRGAVQPATLAGRGTRDALAKVPEASSMRVFESEAAVVQVPDVPRAIEPEEEAALAVSMSEATRFEGNNLTEFEHHIAVAEPKHETAVVEVTEVPRLEGPTLPKEATVVEIAATVSQVQLRASVP